ncbi:T9SS C-terminal target domain-containing protein [Flavobacterium arcticum]|uniref:T9SS C-terminal target domain-containing protein n=1 Tax=Flavobacterium arcticum TaxID=1784713 RepID=A0A345HA80_9FLAO|nr:T9SS type A sorting domain-containing protein [Flavobacterium arcticum]AXG73490.1 T9SS C-terminal target domain-containing protein [Flavobacterium arcticum]KAF2513279.1 T9SS type A sorting domain-containing protein [Flavobacterium arcticum]
MKKIILIAGLLLCGIAQAQITVTGNGEAITEGQTFTFNTLDAETATLDLHFTNTSTESVNIKMKVLSISNNTAGTSLQFCIDPQCFFSISEGSTVPSNPQSGLTLEAGASSTGDNHFWSSYTGDNESMSVSYTLAIITVDGSGNELNQLISFNYVYSSTANINDFEALQNAGISLESTIIKNNMEINAQQNASLELYNMNGQLIKSVTISTGNQSIDLSSLSSAIYIARFATEDNKTSQIRVVKQ